MLRHFFFEHSHHTHLGALYYATAAAWPDRGLDAFHGLCDPWRWPCSHSWRRLRLCRPYTRQDRADPSRLLPSTGLVAAAGMRLLEAAAASRIPAAPAAQLLQAVHGAAIQLVVGAAARRCSPVRRAALVVLNCSGATHEDELAERSCNASGPSVCTNTRPRARENQHRSWS